MKGLPPGNEAVISCSAVRIYHFRSRETGSFLIKKIGFGLFAILSGICTGADEPGMPVKAEKAFYDSSKKRIIPEKTIGYGMYKSLRVYLTGRKLHPRRIFSMKIEKALCPHCGAPIRIRPGKRVMNCEYCDMQIIISDLELEEEEVSEEDFRAFDEHGFSSRFAGSDIFPEHGSSPQEDGPHFTDFSGGESNGYEETREIPYDDPADAVPLQHGYWTPVGFRTRRLRNMILAGFFYFTLISGVFGAGSDLFSYLCAAVFMFFSISVAFLWKPLVDHLPGLKKEAATGKKTMRIVYILIALLIFSFVS